MGLILKFLFENLNCIYYKNCLFYTVVKTMTGQKFCKHCSQSHDCQKVYQQLGKAKGPSVASKAAVAFLLPIMAFIAALAAFEKILAGLVNSKQARTAISFLLAGSAVLVWVLIVKVINSHADKE